MFNLDNCLKKMLKPSTRVEVLSKPPVGAKLQLVSHFGATPYFEGSEQWPVCPSCSKALSFVCQFRLGEAFHPHPAPVQLFTFFYCWDCAPWRGNRGQWLVRTYSSPTGEKAKTLLPPAGAEKFPACGVSFSEGLSLPDWESVFELNPRIAEAAERENPENPQKAYAAAALRNRATNDLGTSLGGYPLWVQGFSAHRCPLCNAPMHLLAQIDSEANAGINWGDTGCAYLFFCPAHPQEISFEMQCY